ncbi:MAG: hypothetical protein JKY48_01305 [Flavobacteriales bacterium]|nr:hypothetical protein [Flavobacteriales bacterium]
MQALNTSNPEHLEYESGILNIAVLGGIRLEGLDRLRTTLKIQVEHLAIRHNLDLYNDTQVDKLIRKVAGKLEIGTSVTAAALQELTNELEEYRLSEIEKQNNNETQKVQLTEEERKKAELYLTAPNLMERTKEDIGKSGVVGEEMNRLLMYLIFTSRKQNQPLHIVSLGSSGTGKTHLQEKVSELIPEEDKLEITSLSENAFYYFGQRQLQNKLILIEDLDGLSGTGANQGAFYALRELQSKKRISKTVVHKTSRGETKTIHLQVEGPVSVSGCTTKEKIYEDNANRSFLIYLDESAEQDLKIMEYQRRISAGKINSESESQIRKLLQNTQRILQPIKVINPFAEQLQFPQAVFKPRRTNSHYLKFIEAITFYHQYQREEMINEETGEVFIETTIEDIEAANQLMKEILLRKSDELSGACRNYFEELKQYLNENKLSAFTNSTIRKTLRVNHSNQKRYMIELQQAGFIKRNTGNKKKGFNYQIVSVEEYEQLKEGINTVLDKVLEEVQSSVEVHSTNEPLKPNGSKGKTKKFKSSVEERKG